MREILFRGKTTKDKEWVYGDLLHDGYDYDVAIWEQEYKLVTEISPETVGQFTGLIDKNGKKIFEGDVLDCKSGLYERCKVIFNEYCSAFQLMCADGFSDFFLCSINHKEMEIIGNIHDNPELLENT